MKVKDLIDLLQSYDPDLSIVYACCSEYTILNGEDLQVIKLHPRRPDGWVHKFDPKQAKIDYLAFPGN